MKNQINHLPEHKQQELNGIVEFLKEELDLDMLILFGSYARGDWVEDLDEETLYYRYQSDFDLLIITQTHSYAQKQAFPMDTLICCVKPMWMPVTIPTTLSR